MSLLGCAWGVPGTPHSCQAHSPLPRQLAGSLPLPQLTLGPLHVPSGPPPRAACPSLRHSPERNIHPSPAGPSFFLPVPPLRGTPQGRGLWVSFRGAYLAPKPEPATPSTSWGSGSLGGGGRSCGSRVAMGEAPSAAESLPRPQNRDSQPQCLHTCPWVTHLSAHPGLAALSHSLTWVTDHLVTPGNEYFKTLVASWASQIHGYLGV